MAYTAPTFKDRVAIGDNKYTMSDAGGGKILLTPAPDEVTESGTDINKMIMQPLCDTVEAIDNQTVPAVTQLLPYNLYYWLSRGISGYYSEVQTLAWGNYRNCEMHHSSLQDRTAYIMYLFLYTSSGDTTSCRVSYSSSISISQSNGAVTLSSPRTTTLTTSQSYSEIEDILGGRYVVGLRPNDDQIFYVPTANRISRDNWYVDGAQRDYVGYVWDTYGDETVDEGSGTRIMSISSRYNSTNTDWGVISSTEPDTYPASGTVDGTEYIKLGRIDEAFLNYARNNPSAFQSIIASYEARISALEAAIAGI